MRELRTLFSRWGNRIDDTALKHFFGASPGSDITLNSDIETKQSIVEVVPINKEQRSAVESAFFNDLTVVTGPPGTNKPQIVTTLIANAWLRKQSVLFASYNHKAVDVVEERVNRLSGMPLLLRTVRYSRDRNLRQEIVEFMSNILSFDVSDDHRLKFNDVTNNVERSVHARDNIWQSLEELRNQRNYVNDLDKEIIKLIDHNDLLKEDLKRLEDDQQEVLDDIDQRITDAHELRVKDENELKDKIAGIKKEIHGLEYELQQTERVRDRNVEAVNFEFQ